MGLRHLPRSQVGTLLIWVSDCSTRSTSQSQSCLHIGPRHLVWVPVSSRGGQLGVSTRRLSGDPCTSQCQGQVSSAHSIPAAQFTSSNVHRAPDLSRPLLGKGHRGGQQERRGWRGLLLRGGRPHSCLLPGGGRDSGFPETRAGPLPSPRGSATERKCSCS